MRKWEVVFLIFIIIGLFKAQAYAGAWSVNDTGATRVGMYAVIGKVTDPTAIFHNVANLAEEQGTRINASCLLGEAQVRFKILKEIDPDTGEDYYTDVLRPDINYGAFPFLGIAFSAGLENWTFGIANYLPNLTGGIMDENSEARYYLIRGFFATNYTSFIAAKRISQRLSLGASLDAVSAFQYGYVKMNIEDLTGLPILKNDLRVFMEMHKIQWSYHLSALYKPAETVKIGISYFEKVNFHLDGDLTIKTSGGEKIWGYDRIDLGVKTNMLVPRTIKMGMNFTINPKWNWGLDLYWWDYSKFKTQKRVLDYTKAGEIGPILREFLGEKIYTPKNYSDSFQVCIGAEHILNQKWKIRFGMMYDESPIPNETFSIDALTSDFIGITSGFEYRTGENSTLAIGYQHVHFYHRNIKNSLTVPPTNVKILESFTESIMFEYVYKF